MVFLQTIYLFHLHHVISQGVKCTGDMRGVVVIVSQKFYQERAIQGERGKETHFKITQEEKYFDEEGRVCVCAHGGIMTGN